MVAVWLAVTAAAAAVTVALYARDLSKPQADFTLAALALSATGLALVMAWNAWARRKNLKKIEQAARAAAVRADPGDGTARSRAAQVRCLECGAESAEATEACARCGAPTGLQQPVAAAPAAGGSGSQRASGYSRREALVVAGAGVVMLGALIAVIGVTNSSVPSTNQLTADQLQSGDCLAGSNMGLGASSPWPDYVTPVACTKPHIAEIFFAGNIWPQSLAYPGDSAVSSQSDARCNTAFADYDGMDQSQSVFTYQSIVPSSSDWASGDRLLVCVAYKSTSQYPGGAPVNDSIKGSYL